ncbi:MAG: hypothetical protein M1133_08390 [Armatimonadetes bacterium]|nr:hypothetical protein [Armatimonadota bacterium]
MATIEYTKAKMEQVQADRRDDAQLASMQQFYREMCRSGVATKQEYTLPPINTSDVSTGQQYWLISDTPELK